MLERNACDLPKNDKFSHKTFFCICKTFLLSLFKDPCLFNLQIYYIKLFQKPFSVEIVQKKSKSLFQFYVVKKFTSNRQVFVCLLYQESKIRQWTISKSHRQKQARIHSANYAALHETVVDLDESRDRLSVVERNQVLMQTAVIELQ